MMQSCHIMQPLSWGSIQHPHRRLPHLLFLLFLYSLTSCSNGITSMTEKEATVPLLGAIPDTPFRCLGHSAGYYADPDTGCQVYHMCDSLERQYSYLCPNYTLFNQKFMVCDHWYMVNCSSSPTFYHLNSHIGEVPGKTEGEEEQNAITVGPEGDASPRRSKGTLPQTPLTGAPFPPSGPSKDASRPRLGFKQSGTLPVKGTLFKTPTKPVTPATRFAFTTTPKPSTSSHRPFAFPLTLPPNTPPSKQPFTSPIKPHQSFTPPSKDPLTPVRQPSPLNTRPSLDKEAFNLTTSIRKSTTPTRQSTTSTRESTTRTQSTTPTRQSTTPTRQSTTSTRQSTTSTKQSTTPTRQLTTPTRQSTTPTRQSTPSTKQSTTRTQSTTPTRRPFTFPVTQSPTRLSQRVTATIPAVQKPPSLFFTLPKTEFSTSHNVEEELSTVKHSSTHTHATNSSRSTTSSFRPPSITRTHTTQAPAIQTEQPHTSITKKPASVARGPGNRFSFTNHREEEIALTPEDLQRIVFQPLLARPRTKTRRVLTSAPSLLPIDPANITDPHLHHFPMRIEFPDPVIPEDSSSRSSLDLKLSNSQGTQAPPHLLISPSVSPAVHPLSTFLSPPTHPFTPIMRMRQEFPTPLAVPQEDHNLRTSPRETFLPGARRLPFPSSTRGNRDFFIPSTEFSELSLLVSELSPNILEEPAQNPSHSTSDHDHHHHHHGDHMTMVFPAPIEPHMMEELKLNPECPRCHPEFLKPGQCNPCVVIK
ncbi:mucin-2-like [Scylla paramamosain]|uniref:mucin-2-like n=1 Tax=Scylla paramamosain TaxID=85552 RepID=UPI0030836DFA